MTIPDEIPALTADTWHEGLDEREQLFVLEWLKDMNVKAAAIRAGYAETVAMTHAFGWLSKTQCTKPHVARAVEFFLEMRREALAADAYMIFEEVKAIALSDLRRIATWRAHRIEEEDEEDVDGIVRVRTIVSNTIELVNSEDLADADAKAIKEITQDKDGNVTVKLHDKSRAITHLAKMLGLGTTQTVKHVGAGGGPITHVHVGMTAKEAADAWRDMIAGDDE